MTGRDEDETWRAIVENYGERPALPDPEPDEQQQDEQVDPADGRPEPVASPDDEDPGFVPPEPPPLPHVAGPRLAAWLGVLGVPVVVVLLLLLGLHVASWFGLLLVASFVGGFVYLVAQMSRDPRDPFDDGSRL